MMYAYVFVTDKYEGLITVNIATLGDGNPDNNFFKRGATYNPERHSQWRGEHHDRRQLCLHRV